MENSTNSTTQNQALETEDLNVAMKNEQDESTDKTPKETAAATKKTKEDDQGSESFMELYEESLKSIQEGEVVTGEIVQIDDEYILVDIGYKSEGQIRINEFIDDEGKLTAKVGDTVEVLLERREDDEGIITLSKEKAAKIKVWDQIREIYEKDATIKGKITSRVKGGLSVDIGLPAFLPGSQVDLRPIRNMDSVVGTEHEFKIVKYNKRRGNIVLSRRAILENERAAQREETIKHLEEGTVVEGAVKNITDYGLFIDLGGLDGLVHITDMSWGRVGHPSEIYQLGDEIKVKILSFDKEKERVSLGIKQLTPDPWIDASEKYTIGTKIKGRVVSLTDYGAFLEVEQGVEGLIHISEMSWTRKVRHPSQILNIGDDVDVLVLNIDVDKKRISLGMKQVEPNPWDIIEEKYPVGTTIEGKIKNITDFGIFIGIDEGIDGLVHISDISWTKRIKHPSEVYKKGQEVQAVVLNIDIENERFSLGIKQLKPDPWDEIPEKYKPGTRVTGTVTNLTDFGLFLELEEGIEGLVHISEVTGDKHGNPLSRFQVDDVIQAKVLNVSKEDKKIGLSIRKLEESDEKEILQNYMNSKEEAKSNLGELLREEMMNFKPSSEQPEPETTESVEEETDIQTDAKAESDDESEAEASSSEAVDTETTESVEEETDIQTDAKAESGDESESKASSSEAVDTESSDAAPDEPSAEKDEST